MKWTLNKRLVLYGAGIVAVLVAVFAVRQPIVYYTSNAISFVKEYSDAHESMLEVLRQEIFSQPLRANIAGDGANLSPVEIIRLTNLNRQAVGAQPLVRNVILDQVAARKLQDMFDRQYFDHISPDGKGPGALATDVGYSYVVIGENLAMGSFQDDQALMDAWMASEGHKENILNTRYTEIGVAVGHGTFNGERIWIAVQEFGKPTSACPTIDPNLKSTIDANKTATTDMETKITAEKAELDTMDHSTPEENAAYNQKVQEYNNLVTQYNAAITQLKTDIDTYNTEVKNFNSCASR